MVLVSFALGMVASGSCIGLCMPFFVPYVIQKDKTARQGLITSLIFSGGRLVVYFMVGMVFYFILSTAIKSAEDITDLGGFKYVPLALGVIIVIYGVLTITKAPLPKVCPAKYAKGAVTMVMGILIGSSICPPFIFMLVGTLQEPFIIFVLSVFAFWLASSIAIILLGILSGKLSSYLEKQKSREYISNVTSFILILAGLWFIASVFIPR